MHKDHARIIVLRAIAIPAVLIMVAGWCFAVNRLQEVRQIQLEDLRR